MNLNKNYSIVRSSLDGILGLSFLVFGVGILFVKEGHQFYWLGFGFLIVVISAIIVKLILRWSIDQQVINSDHDEYFSHIELLAYRNGAASMGVIYVLLQFTGERLGFNNSSYLTAMFAIHMGIVDLTKFWGGFRA